MVHWEPHRLKDMEIIVTADGRERSKSQRNVKVKTDHMETFEQLDETPAIDSEDAFAPCLNPWLSRKILSLRLK